jgi:methyl-accepting chemotaxis protein
MQKSKISISTKFFMLLMLVIGMNGVAYYWILQNVYQQELKAQAQTVVANVESFGTWVAHYGRVWVKDKSDDSYLSEISALSPESAEARIHFYSKNPALAQREFSEVVAKSTSPAKFRMTSHNVMNPVNLPNAFERVALDVVRNTGVNEYAEFVNGEYRYAKAVKDTASCIVCHGDASKAPEDVIKRYGSANGFGFKEGDVAGIISVSIPASALYANIVKFIGFKEVALIALSLFFALWFVRASLLHPIKALTQVAHDISTGGDAAISTEDIAPDSRNEVHQLILALSRMKNSTQLAIKKMKEAKAAASEILVKAKVAVSKAREEGRDQGRDEPKQTK